MIIDTYHNFGGAMWTTQTMKKSEAKILSLVFQAITIFSDIMHKIWVRLSFEGLKLKEELDLDSHWIRTKKADQSLYNTYESLPCQHYLYPSISDVEPVFLALHLTKSSQPQRKILSCKEESNQATKALTDTSLPFLRK